MKLVNSFPFWPLILGLILGGGIGALLGYFGQCSSGMCPLTSTWWRGAIFGAILGTLFGWSNLPRAPEPGPGMEVDPPAANSTDLSSESISTH